MSGSRYVLRWIAYVFMWAVSLTATAALLLAGVVSIVFILSVVF